MARANATRLARQESAALDRGGREAAQEPGSADRKGRSPYPQSEALGISFLTDAAGEHASAQIRCCQKIAFRPEDGQLVNRREVFVVVRQLPETGSMFQYQIKSEIDSHVRMVREIELTD